MNDITTLRMMLATAVLAAAAAMFAGAANAMPQDVGGGGGSATASVEQSLFNGQSAERAAARATGVNVALAQESGAATASQPGLAGDSALTRVDPAIRTAIAAKAAAEASANVTQPGTIPYLSHGIGVDESLFSGRPSLGLNGDSAATRYPGVVSTPLVSGDEDLDWTSFGAGAGMAALLAAAVAGVVLTTRRRGGVALP
jgi:hypothetical protein